ncbi:MAG: hypothetical protein AAB622_00745 [Patescibacteria group bacterium]
MSDEILKDEIFKNDGDLKKAGYVNVAPEIVAGLMTNEHKLALTGLLIEEADFGAGYRTFISADGKVAIVVPVQSSWPNQVNVISFKLDKPLAV